MTLTASGGPVSWSVTESSGLIGKLSVAPASGRLLAGHGVDLEGLERVHGKTFFWAGKYSPDMNDRETLRTDLARQEAGWAGARLVSGRVARLPNTSCLAVPGTKAEKIEKIREQKGDWAPVTIWGSHGICRSRARK